MPYEKFEKGVDSGLQAWLRMRLAAREARLAGGNETIIIRDVPYKYYKPWICNFYQLSGEEIQRIMSSSDQELWHYSISLENNFLPPLPDFMPTLSVKEILNLNPSFLNDKDLESIINRIMQERTNIFLEAFLSNPYFHANFRVGSRRCTLLHLTCSLGDIDKTIVLINQKCKVNVADTEGLTPLHYCMHPAEEAMHSVTLTQLLLNQKASIDICDQQQRSALHYACILQSEKLVLTLLQKGANLAILDNFHKFPLDYLHEGPLKRAAERYLTKPVRRGQLVRITARTLSTSFMRDVFHIVQPRCVVCRHTVGTCILNKKRNYRLWLFQHGRIRTEYVGSALMEANKLSAAILAQDPPPGANKSSALN